jgi:PAS domain S-box-containing protein
MKAASNKSEPAILHRKTGELLKKKPSKTGLQFYEAETLKLIHELEVHKVELEMQNEELRLAKEQLAKAATEKYAELYDFAPSGYFTLSKDGEIIELNLCGAQMLGQVRSRLKNNQFSFFVSNATKPTFNLFLRKVFNSKARESCEVTLSLKGNLPIYAYLSGIVTENGKQCLVTMVDITERKRAENELIIAREKAEENDRLKTAFLQNMSHEIRSPMNAIMGFSQLMVKQYNNKPKLEYYSNVIYQQCVGLLDIINEILDIAKIDSGQLPIHLEECKLESLFSELSVFFKENQKRLGKQHIGLNIHANCDPSGLVIITDKVKLKQIFVNLIDNAFKFTERGTIQAGCKLNEKMDLIFYVSDTGIGIPADKHNKIFERFIQLDSGENRLYGGTGLGLSIVKGLINLLGGEIWLESQPHKGTTFYFALQYGIADTMKPQEPIKIDSHANFNFTDKMRVSKKLKSHMKTLRS